MKLVKNILITGLFALSMHANAGSGKAIIPHWADASSNGPSTYFISNITDNYINVKVVFYGKNGQELSPTEYINFSANNTQLEPNATGYVKITSSVTEYGYATIEWENNDGDNNTLALVAHGFRQIIESSRRSAITIPINDGEAF